ncbi:MAG: preprotein translocase subunit SecE [Oscillospiraceae bacterium]
MSENEKLEQEELTDEALAAEAEAAAAPVKAEKPAKKESKTTKSGKPAKKEKPSFFARIARWFREMKSELKKVQWPTWKQTLNNVLIVLVCVIIVGAFIWCFDWLARMVYSALLALFGK